MTAIGTNNTWISEFQDAARPLLTPQEYNTLSINEKEEVLAAYGFHPRLATQLIYKEPELPMWIWEQFIQKK